MAVTEGSIEVTEGSGKKLDTAIVTTGAGSVHREGTFLGDPETAAARVKVTSTDPGGSDYGAVVRVAGTMPLPTLAATSTLQTAANALQTLANLDLDAILNEIQAQTSDIQSTALNTLSIDARLVTLLAGLLRVQGVTSVGVTGPMVQGVVSDTPSSFNPDTVQPLSMTSEGRLRVASVAADIDRVWQHTNENPWSQDNPFAMEESLYV